MPAAVANDSVSRCVTLPGPKLPYESSPGFCLASSMSSRRLFAGTLAWTVRISVVLATISTGTRSFTGS